MNDKKSWSAATKGFVLTTLVLGALWLLFMLKAMLTVLVMAALFAYLLNPIVRLLADKTRWSRPFAARFVFVSFLLGLMALPATLGTVAVDQFHILEVEFLNAISALENWITQPIELFGYQFHPENAVENLDKTVRNGLAFISVESINILSIIATNLILGLLFISSFYTLLMDGHKLLPWLIQFSPSDHRADIRRLLDELNKVWGVFLRVQLLMFVILGIMMGAGFLLVIWLFRSGLIPFSPLALIVLVVLVVTIAQQIDNLWLRPQLMGKSLLLHPWFIFVGLTGTLMSGSLLAVFFVVPVMATVKVLGRYIHLKLLGLPPWPDIPADDRISGLGA